MESNLRTATLCGTQLHGARHVCAFFDSEDEQYEILNPYFAEGLTQGEEVVTIMEAEKHEDHSRRMTAGGIPVEDSIRSGQLKVLPSNQTYTKDGLFVVDRMYSLLGQMLENAKTGPYTGVRTCGDMEWALRNLPGTDELITYEARVNLLTPKHDCTLLCVYDVNRFSGRVIADVLATHSHVVIGGQLYVNQYFVEPVEFLQKMALRHSASAPKSQSELRRH